jgi:tetratricopeptide (TPR) repeat protein
VTASRSDPCVISAASAAKWKRRLSCRAQAQGRYEKAFKAYDRALEIHDKALGPEHRAVASTLNNLAIVWMLLP